MDEFDDSGELGYFDSDESGEIDFIDDILDIPDILPDIPDISYKNLPNDMINEILKTVSIESFINLCQINKKFRNQCMAMCQDKFNQYGIPYNLPVTNWPWLYNEYRFNNENSVMINQFFKNAIKYGIIYFQKNLTNERLISILEELGLQENKLNIINFILTYRKDFTSLNLIGSDDYDIRYKYKMFEYGIIPNNLIKPLITKLFYYGYLTYY